MEVEAGLGDEALDEAGAVLHPLQLRLRQSGELVEAVFREVGQTHDKLRAGAGSFGGVFLLDLHSEEAELPAGRR